MLTSLLKDLEPIKKALPKIWMSFITSVLMASTLTLQACAPKQDIMPTKWDLSTEAQETYITLLLSQSIRNNDLDGMREAAKLIIKAPPDKQRATETAAWLLFAKEYELAKGILTSALATFPNDLNLCLFLAEAYLELNQAQKALEYVQAFAKRNPKHPQIQQELAVLSLKAGKTKEAIALFAALSTKEKTPFILYFYAQAQKAEKNYDEAIIQLQKALNASPEFIEVRLELAALYELQGLLTKAAQTYDALLATKPDLQEPWLRATQFYIQHGQAKKALAITQLVPDAYSFQLATASIMIDAKALAEATQLINRLVQEYPSETDLNFFQAVLVFQYEKNIEKALEYLEALPSDSRFYPQSINLHTHLLVTQKRFREAIDLVRKAQKNIPESSELLQLEVEVLILENNLQEALLVLEKNNEQWTKNTTWLYIRASLYHNAEAQKKALEIMEEIILMDPNHYQALNFIGYTLADEDRDLERALELLTKAVTLAPNEAHILDSLAWAEFKCGNITKALTTIRYAITLPNTNEPIIWEHYGDIAYAAGKKDEAILAWQKALTFKPENATRLQEKLQQP